MTVAKTVLITGGNAGIGKETAVALARAGWRVIITSRDAARGATARDEVQSRSASSSVEVMDLDLADLSSVRRLADSVLAATDNIDVLVNNAGLVLDERRVTVDGFEETFGVNHLGHFLLTNLLIDRLTANPDGARVVVVASEAHRLVRRVRFDDLGYDRHYRGFAAYCHSKLANVLFARELARRLAETSVTANSLHPGYVKSRFGRDGDVAGLFGTLNRIGSLVAISPEQGARTSIYLATSPEVTGISGLHYAKCRQVSPSRAGRDDTAAAELWTVSEQLVDR